MTKGGGGRGEEGHDQGGGEREGRRDMTDGRGDMTDGRGEGVSGILTYPIFPP